MPDQQTLGKYMKNIKRNNLTKSFSLHIQWWLRGSTHTRNVYTQITRSNSFTTLEFCGQRASSSERVRARLERVSRSVEGCRALSFCPQNPTQSMPCEERSCVKSDLGDSASKHNCSCLTWPQIFFSRLSSTSSSSDLVVSRLSFDFKIQGRELYTAHFHYYVTGILHRYLMHFH